MDRRWMDNEWMDAISVGGWVDDGWMNIRNRWTDRCMDRFVGGKMGAQLWWGKHRLQSIPEGQPTCLQSCPMEKEQGTGALKSLSYETVLCH